VKLLAVHPGPLMYTRIFLRLEPLGLELVAAAARRAGNDVRIIDLQVEPVRNYVRMLREWRPDSVCFSVNYLANVPEVIELAHNARTLLPDCLIFAGGHSISFIAADVLAQADAALDCVLRGEAEPAIVPLLAAGREGAATVPGAVTADGTGPPPRFLESLDDLRPARDLLRHRRRYFIGTLDPCASIEFARGCPWDCNFCSAWTFYGRSYRTASPEVVAEEYSGLREPGIFIVDDVAFVHAEHGMAIGEAIARRGIRKQYYLETRADVLLRNKEVFQLWRQLGLAYMYIGLEAIDDERLRNFRKRVSLDRSLEALEFARSLGIVVAINIIAAPNWDRARFATIREWCLEVPEIVNIGVRTPYPGTKIWAEESRALTTRLPPLRHPACRAADEAAPGGILRRAGAHAAGAELQASRLGRATRHDRPRRTAVAAQPDELRPYALEIQQRLQPRTATCGPSPSGALRAVFAPTLASGLSGRVAQSLHPRPRWPPRPRYRRRYRALR
jgi:hopanoid C-3 methylase